MPDFAIVFEADESDDDWDFDNPPIDWADRAYADDANGAAE